MSALTKVFVVLLVVLSMLLTAGLIVFVNRTENWKQVSSDTQGRLASAQRENQELNAQIVVTKSNDDHRYTALMAEHTRTLGELATAQNTLISDQGAIAEAKSAALVSAGTASSANAALDTAQKQNGVQQTTIGKMRDDQANLQKQNNDLNLAVSKLNNQLEVTERARREATEENVQLASDLKAARDLIHAQGLDRGQPSAVVNPTPTIALTGVIRDKKVIAGVPYATISLGSADAVTKSMQFTVIDSNKNQFLGYLTVDTVEPHEATGRLSGPHPDAVQAGAEVRTQG